MIPIVIYFLKRNKNYINLNYDINNMTILMNHFQNYLLLNFFRILITKIIFNSTMKIMK